MREPPSADDATLGFLWPAHDQQLLLDAALLDGSAARDAFRTWRADVKLEEEFSWTVLRLLPLVHENLVRAGEHDLLMGRFKGLARRSWYETRQLFHRVRPAVAALHALGIPMLMLKGAPLVLSYYGHHALRPMSDVDVCVRPADARRSVEALLQLGWIPGAEFTEDYFRFRHALQFRHPDGGELDLHWHALYESLGTQHREWGWAGAEPLDFEGIPMLQPSPTTMLLQLVVHGIRWNEETPVRWIPDAMIVLSKRAHDIDWNRLVADATSLKVTVRLAIGLQWLCRRYAIAVPPNVLARLLSAGPTLTERFEGRVYLRDFRQYTNSVMGNQYTILADLCRVTDPARPFKFAATLPHYLRYRWALEGRSDIVPAVWRAVRRRMRGEVTVLKPSR